MDSSMKMIDLASAIKAHVEQMSESLQAEGRAGPHQDPSTLSTGFRDLQSQALQAIQELQALIRGPFESIMTQTQPEFLPIHLVHDFGLAKAVPLEEGTHTTYRDVAEKCGLPERDVRCILRSAMLSQVFDETKDGLLVHTPSSRLLVEDLQLQAWLKFFLGHQIPSQTKLTEAMRNHPQSSSPSESGFALAHNHQSMYNYFKSKPELGKAFSFGINALSRSGGMDVYHLTENLLPKINSPGRKWVDIGGGDGEVMIELSRKDPSVQCIVQDLPHTVATWSAQHKRERVTFMAHDFFTPQPVVDADTYLLRNILHNWSDADCINILTRVVEVMKPSATIIINDRVLPEKGEVPAVMEHRLRYMDLYMRALFNSHEREIGDWNNLLGTPSLGLEIEEVIRPKYSDLAILILRLKSVEHRGQQEECSSK